MKGIIILKNSSMKLFNSLFSHIYVEQKVLKNPITKTIIQKFKNSKVMIIDDYKNVFSGFDQNFSLQKNSQKLILAEKKENFIYKGSKMCHDFDNSSFFYTNNIINCLYDCKYCYLGGMYPSSNIVIFVNLEDYFKELEKLSKKNENIYLSLGYDTDYPLFEFVYPFIEKWLGKILNLKNINVEIRTKSKFLHNILPENITERVIPAWTINPQQIITKYEFKTPSLKDRLQSIKKAQEKGWKVRLSIDPIIIEENFEDYYSLIIEKIFTYLDPKLIRDISIGLFRISNIYLKNLKKHSNSSIAFDDYKVIDNIASYKLSEKERAINYVLSELIKYIQKEKIFII
ncbi:MAG: radical SAM protein [Thermotogota bacterium]